MTKRKELETMIDGINKWYKKNFSLVNMGGKKYWIANNDTKAKSMWLKTWNLDNLIGFCECLTMLLKCTDFNF